jgi:CRP-like cAMP-binding protein
MNNLLQSKLHQAFGTTDDQLQAVVQAFERETLTKNQFFLRRNQYCDRLSLIESGYLRIYANQNDREITQWISSPGYLITEIQSFLFGQRSRYSIQALEAATLWSISQEDYQNLDKKIQGWHNLERKFIGHCFATLENRVFALLSKPADIRYKEFFSYDPEIFNRVPLKHIASMLGMTPETLSRLRQQLQ